MSVTISERYRALQTALHAEGNYGLAALRYGPTVLELLRVGGARTLLDYGCGSKRSLLMGMTVPPGVRYEGYDPAVPQYATPPSPAELVVCIDVLEHIEEAYLDNVLDELASLCTAFGFFTIHTGPAGKFLADGRNAHLIQQGPAWWLPRIDARFAILSVQPVPNGFAVIVQSKDWGLRPR
ncbi:MAG TPA: methyltransferase domain-containing protein [Burkholderiaceae bacterium]|nr:methyltransferase domain-containing protein [Burkholderiaceae bacterium]